MTGRLPLQARDRRDHARPAVASTAYRYSMVADPVWSSECGNCHHPFHPSLLPRSSWATLMAGLYNHFGRDASLPAAERMTVAAFLDRYAAEAWDSEAARRFVILSPREPLRITATPYWAAKHAGVDRALFGMPAVRSRSNCIACHKDADSGRFDDQAISLPAAATSGARP